MRTIRFKLVFLYLTLVFIVMLITGTMIILSIQTQETQRLKAELAAFSGMVYGEVLANPNKREANYADELSQLTRAYGNRIDAAILTRDGYDMAERAARKDTAITGAMLGKPTFNTNAKAAAGDKNKVITYAMPYPYNPSVSLTVSSIIYASVSTAAMESRISEIARIVILASFVALILTMVIGLIFSSTLTEPIAALTKNAEELARGDLLTPIPVMSDDEIGRLTETFNDMAFELRQTLENITTQKNKMEILLFNMKDGVLAYDVTGALIEANYSAQEQLGLSNIKDMSFLEMAEAVNLEIEEYSARKIRDIKDVSLVIGQKYINMIFSPYFNTRNIIDGVVIVLQDVTEHKKLDEMRKEFVANVSHEIRTPLTTIKSYTETLLETGAFGDETARNFLSVINKEADRMTLLVRDLLELSRLDSLQYSLDQKVCNLIDIIKNALAQVAVLAKKKNQTVRFNISPDANYLINADKARIDQVFVNILSNSVKYSPENTAITVYTDKSERYYRVYIKDEGFGIPKEDLSRVFERFYRVDKARSREMGGTGLGLSIAKGIMDAHGFRITANSEAGKGTTMILRFTKINR